MLSPTQGAELDSCERLKSVVWGMVGPSTREASSPLNQASSAKAARLRRASRVTAASRPETPHREDRGSASLGFFAHWLVLKLKNSPRPGSSAKATGVFD